MTMTLEQFLEKLEQTPRDWYLDVGFGAVIRRGKGADETHCPITAVCGGDLSSPRTAGTMAGMSCSLAGDIAAAADSRRESELRAKLLKACGL